MLAVAVAIAAAGGCGGYGVYGGYGVCGICDGGCHGGYGGGCGGGGDDGGDKHAGVSEKEWTHHGLLLISGLHQMAECSSREAVAKEQIAEARIEGVKVRWSIVLCAHTESLDAR